MKIIRVLGNFEEIGDLEDLVEQILGKVQERGVYQSDLMYQGFELQADEMETVVRLWY